MSFSASQKRRRQNAFGATSPPFIDYLKDILRRYPDGGQILKELIQNADDAGATEVVFIHDARSYGTQTLWTEDLEKYQGPALYAYNNAEFTETDWRGIQATGRSVKRNDPNKVGRFGIGFNSIYHVTDNRRQIKWQEEDQRFDEAAVWNELLIKEVLPRAYHMIILDAIHFSLPSSSVYRLWPDIEQMKHKERWHGVATEMLQQFLLLNKSVFSLARNAVKWVTLSEAVFLSDDDMEPQMKNVVSGVLIALGEKLVSIPSHVSRAIQTYVKNPKTLRRATPAFVRKVLYKTGTVNLSREDKLFILEYVLSDGEYDKLSGLQLLPLSNGTFNTFTNEDHNLAFIDNEQFPRELLPGWKDVFLPRDLQSKTVVHLRTLAKTSKKALFL
ncbi:hypothetical protein SKAU_G00251800 [Synaphobranchus kaupii]|uniref:Sacsin/Nov domain-containing protein n=1 Tax=Synaphobranchus kaupii TaxID=118154 RepID=A0A9Q1F390_SYNKA|nr:hypothetical protein SKAU_G00251800 [Synaphobranchus kaupii]